MTDPVAVVGTGVQETKEALSALNLLAVDLIKLLKKHSGTTEVVVSLLGDDALKSALLKAYEGISKVPSEVKDLTISEGMELALVQIQALPDLVAALKG